MIPMAHHDLWGRVAAQKRLSHRRMVLTVLAKGCLLSITIGCAMGIAAWLLVGIICKLVALF